MTLKDLKIGESAVITSVGGEGALRQHFLDMGVIPGAEATLVKYAELMCENPSGQGMLSGITEM